MALRWILFTLLLLVPCHGVSYAATFNPVPENDAVDANPGDGVCATSGGICTLRAAVMEANALAGADVVSMRNDTYELTLFGEAANTASEGDLHVSEDLTFIGRTEIRAAFDDPQNNFSDDLFTVGGGATLRLRTTTLLPDLNGVFIQPGGRLELDQATIEGGTRGVSNNCGAVEALSSMLISNNHTGIESYRRIGDGDPCASPLVPEVTLISSQVIDSGAIVEDDSEGRSGISQECGPLTIEDSIISGAISSQTAFGDGIVYDTDEVLECPAQVQNIVTIENSTISGNNDDGLQVGGDAPVTVDISNSTLRDNGGSGVIAFENVTATISGSLLAGNGDAGIKLTDSTLDLRNVTLSGNRNVRPLNEPLQNPGGALVVTRGTANLNNVTIAGNLSTTGGGIFVDASSSGSFANSIIAGNETTSGLSPDCNFETGLFSSQGFNLIGNGDGCLLFGGTDQIGSSGAPLDPLLCPLTDNFGPTETHALADGSPARDAANPAGAGSGACESVDQRSVPRPLDGDDVPGAICDVGAFEAGGPEDCAVSPPPITLYAVRMAGGVDLFYDGADASGCLLTGTDGFGALVDPAEPGSISVDPQAETTYTLACTSPEGIARVSVQALTCDQPEILAAQASVTEEVAPPEPADIFVLDRSTGKILRIERDSGEFAIVNPSAGCLVAGASSGLSLDARLNLYVVQSESPTLVKVDSFTGVETDASIAGSFLPNPIDVTVATEGTIYALEDTDRTIVSVDPETLLQSGVLPVNSFVDGRALAARGPQLVVSDADRLVVVDPVTESIVGNLPAAGPTPLAMPRGLAVEGTGSVLVIDPVLLALLRVDEAGSELISSNATSANAPFVDPVDVAIDLNGQFLVSDGGSVLSVDPAQGLRGVVASGPFDFGGMSVLPPGAIETFEELPVQDDPTGIELEGVQTFSVTLDGLAPASVGQQPNVVATLSGPLAASLSVASRDDNEFLVLSSNAGTTGPEGRIMELAIPGEAEQGATGPYQDFFSQPVDLRNATLSFRVGLQQPSSALGQDDEVQVRAELTDVDGNRCETEARAIRSGGENIFLQITASNCGGGLVFQLGAIRAAVIAILSQSGSSVGDTRVEVDDVVIVLPQPATVLLQAMGVVVLVAARRLRKRGC